MLVHRWVLPEDRLLIKPVQGAVFDRGTLVMEGTNVRVGDVVDRFINGDTAQQLALDFDVTVMHIEAALRTALRARKRHP